MATKPPDAFLSYTRVDDQHDGGAISQFRVRLASAVRVVSGEPFEIFQDVDGIGLGEHWPGKLDQMLSEARFFILIVTPSYFTSKPCRDELEKFLRAESERGRNDLVLPIYYIECEVLQDEELRAADPLANTVYERQRQDWRELRFRPFRDAIVRKALEQLAREIVKARRRPMPPRRVNEAPATTTTAAGPTAPSAAPKPQYTVGTVFRDVDAPWCPEMIVIPPGAFLMGSPESEGEWYEFEGPLHLVRINYPLAVGCYPLIFEEYDHFARTMGREQPGDENWGRGRRPVINVSWDDAKAYVEWLASATGQTYRLLSEAEWEYACRAGTTTRYWWGDEFCHDYATSARQTSEVGRYPANPWGLYDMHGNVREWVEDCWNDGYKGAPDDGSAWTSGNCRSRVQRGGGWDDDPDNLSVWARFFLEDGAAKHPQSHGFRVARTLSGPPATMKGSRSGALHDCYPVLSGRVTFNYSNNDGRYGIGSDEFFFETQWSRGSDQSIYLYSNSPSILGVAEIPAVHSYENLGDPASYDMSSRVRTIQKGENALLRNRYNKYALLRVLDIKDRTRSDTVDELTLEFCILADGS